MHNSDARMFINWTKNPDLNSRSTPKIAFLSPVVQAVVAAAVIGGNERLRNVEFGSSDCSDYARYTGFADAVKGNPPVGDPGRLHGQTYSSLTRLATHAEVDKCNEVIGNLLYSQVPGGVTERFRHEVAKVVGELHDNVASHASGAGFSAAQIYKRKRLEFSIADCGRGMLRNVRSIRQEITSHADAIQWCLERGNTTWVKPSEWAQRTPESISGVNIGTETFVADNHHAGLGLWKLIQLVHTYRGSLWVWSGDSYVTVNVSRTEIRHTKNYSWDGVAIEFEFDLQVALNVANSHSRRADTAGGLGL